MSISDHQFLDEVITLQRGFDLPTLKRKEGPFPVVASSGVAGYHNEWKVEGPGVTIGRSGSIGGGQYIKTNFWPLNTTLWVKDFKEHNPQFVYYLLRSIDFSRFNAGAGVPTLNRNHIGGIKVPHFREIEEDKIADILASYDNLIEINTKRIELLLDSVRQLYREWFLQFRFPGHEHVPVTNGLPDGWEKHKVGTLLQNVKRPGKIKKEDYLVRGAVPCVDQSREFIGGYTDLQEARISEPLPIVIFGDHTRILKFVDFPFVCGADGTQLLHPNAERISIEYFYFALDAIVLSNYFYARHFKFLKDQEILIPPDNLIEFFTDFAADTMKQISILRRHSRELSEARDLLLPKLMTGNIAV